MDLVNASIFHKRLFLSPAQPGLVGEAVDSNQRHSKRLLNGHSKIQRSSNSSQTSTRPSTDIYKKCQVRHGIKLRPHEQVFTRDCNAIFRNYCVAIARKKATRLHSAMAKFAIDKLPEYSELSLFQQLFRRCCIARARHATHRNL